MALDTESFELLLAVVQRFVLERLVPAENHLEEHDEVPADIIEDMKAMGLFGLTVPEEYGGIGLSAAQEVVVNYELGRTAAAFRSVFGTNIGIGSQGILMDGTLEQKAEYLPKVASGELIMSFALTEPDAGTDAASLKTRAELDGDHYVLNGTKRYITNAPRAGAFTLMARTGGLGAGGVSSFIVDANTPGLKLGKNDKKMGQRGTKTCDVILENVRVPVVNIIGGVPGQGFKTAMKVLDRGRIHIAAVAMGMCDRLIEMSVRYAMERKQFGQAIAEFQLVQGMLADSQVDAFATEALLESVARKFDAGQKVSRAAAALKYFSSEAVGRVADRAVQIHGGAGYMTEYKVERFYRDVRLLRIYEGTSQIQQLIIARDMIREAGASG